MNIKHSKGMTLAELLIAAGILVFALCGLLVLFVSCSFMNEANRNLTLAVSHAQYIMEEIKDAYFSEIKIRIDDGDWDLSAADIATKGLSALSNESIDTSYASDDNPLEITVDVQWQDRRQRQRQTELRTLITNEGIYPG